MSDVRVDVAVLGSGFSGSLTALCLNKIGRTVALLEQGKHPRFAIGESSTPIANMMLRDLASKYDLPRVAPLAKYGTWRDNYPQLTCGLKRGFSYFAHRRGEPFHATDHHAHELLVAASADDPHSDTHWLRADIDRFLFDEAAAEGIHALDRCRVHSLHKDDAGGWHVECERNKETLSIRAAFLIDASGASGIVPRALNIAEAASSFQTHSRAIYSHFHGVRPWKEYFEKMGGRVADHPFDCDHAAQHHILDDAWLWVLRFTNGVTSAGLVLDNRRYPLDTAGSEEEEWSRWLARYPSLARMFEEAAFADAPGRLVRTGNLQRRWSKLVGRDWALLPHTAGFVDPLHSTGIAHSLCGVQRIVQICAELWGMNEFVPALHCYEAGVHQELDLIDALVSACYTTMNDFDHFTAASMLYFAAATSYEHLYTEGNRSLRFLCAGDPRFQEAVRGAAEFIASVNRTSGAVTDFDCSNEITRLIRPFNRVGLCDHTVNNMYPYTAAPIS